MISDTETAIWLPEEAHHRRLGMTDSQVRRMYALMLLARKTDDRMFALNRQGRVPFVVGSSGHEGIQVGSALALDHATDWLLPYYRDMGVALAWGIPILDIFLATFAKRDDPMSGGRQLPNHWSSPERRIFTQSSTIGTQYPHAAGIAHGLRIQGRPGVVAVYGGEGSTSEGDWHEAMNWIGIHRLPVIVIIENNQYAISVPSAQEVAGSVVDRAHGYGIHGELVDGNDPLMVFASVHRAATRAREGGGPTLIEAQTYRYYAHTSDDDDRLYRSREEVNEWRRNDPVVAIKQYLIENRLLTSAEEAAVMTEVEEALSEAVAEAEAAADPDEPLTHVYVRPIEPSEPALFPESAPTGEEVNIITAVNRALHEIFAAHPDAVIFGEDVAGDKGGVFKATVGISSAFGADRCFNSPLAESVIVGAAVGIAATGLRPFAEIQFGDYIMPAFDQIVSEVARIHYRSNGTWRIPLVIRVPYGAGIRGALYHSQSIESLFAHIPGLKVVIPSTPADAKGLLWSAFEDPDPVMVLEPKKLYRLGTGPFPKGEHRVPIGRAAIRRPGSDLTLVAYGAMAHFALQAGEVLAAQGVSAEIIDLRSIKPLDWPTIAASVKKTSRILIVHEDNEFCGFGAEVAAQVADKAFEWLDAPVKRYALPDVPIMPYSGALEDMLYPTPGRIAEQALAVIRY